jgi:cysteinyl-tRNA synthetase
MGLPVDIHVSSVDFLFPHLENLREIGEAITGKPFANIWMLCERIWSSQDEKQESHLDENLPVREFIAAGYTPVEVRYWLLNTHYRKPIHITSENIANAKRGYERLKEFVSRTQHAHCNDRENRDLPEMIYALEQAFLDAMADDLNIPAALAALFRFVRQANPIFDLGDFTEAQRKQILDVLKKLNGLVGVLDTELLPLDAKDRALIELREAARKAKKWAEADRLRTELLKRGLKVLDTPAGTRCERLHPPLQTAPDEEKDTDS